MNYFDYIFYVTYERTSRVNKLIPLFATLVFLAITFSFNIITVLFLVNPEFNAAIAKITFPVTLLICYLYYAGKRSAIMRRFKEKNVDKGIYYLAAFYPLISILGFFIVMDFSLFSMIGITIIYGITEMAAGKRKKS